MRELCLIFNSLLLKSKKAFFDFFVEELCVCVVGVAQYLPYHTFSPIISTTLFECRVHKNMKHYTSVLRKNFNFDNKLH